MSNSTLGVVVRRVLVVLLLLVAGCGSSSPGGGGSATAVVPACHAQHVNLGDPQAWLPDPGCTPGATDGGLPAGLLCPSPDTGSVRPPVSYTNSLKGSQMRAYGFTGSPAGYEEDHLVPLELGGAPRDPLNLWPEPYPAWNEKDGVEDAAHTAVCSGRVDLVTAQRRMASDWYAFGQDLGVVK